MKRRKRKLKNQRKKILGKVLVFHTRITAVFLVFYLIFSFVLDPGFIFRDAQKKYAQAANVVVGITVPNDPGIPVATAVAGCVANFPYVDLNWNTTTDTTSYNISRNALPLVSGLTNTFYKNNSVSENTSYNYSVTAVGPMGETQSAIVSATTPSNCNTAIPASCVIQTIQDTNVANFAGYPQIEDTTPIITGTTNIANAIISLNLIGHPLISATIFANANGYWSWSVPDRIEHGRHVIMVTALSPSDPTYFASDFQAFEVTHEKETNEQAKEDETAPLPGFISTEKTLLEITSVPETLQTEKIQVPLKISVQVKNLDKTIYTGKDLEAEISLTSNNSQEVPLEYIITDSKDREVFSFSEKVFLEKNLTFSKNIPLPRLLAPGKYKIKIRIVLPDSMAFSEDIFYLKEPALFNLASGLTLTLTQIMEKISWIILLLLLAILIFLILLGIEYRSVSAALFQITDNFLGNKGLKRKEVSR